MNKTGKTIAKNASFLMISQLLTWGMALLMLVFLPRYLGVAGMGQLHLATSIWAIMAIAVSLGMNTLLIKEIARDREKIGSLFGTSIVIRLIISILGFSLIALYTWFAKYDIETVYVIFIIGIGSTMGQVTTTCSSTLQGLERMELISLSDVVSKGITTIISIVLLLLGYGVLVVASVIVFGSIINLAIQLFGLHRIYELKIRFDKNIIGWILRASLPYLFINISLVIYVQIDIVIISLLIDEQGVGWYAAADRLFSTLLFIPTVFIAAVFPAMSRMYADHSDSLQRLMRKSFSGLLIVGIPIGLGVLVIANSFVVQLYGSDFANSGPILALLGIVLILTYQNILIGRFLISTDRQNTWTVVMVVATLATIPLDLILIPWCQQTFGNGAIGGALAFIVTETGMLIAGIAILPKGSLGVDSIWIAVRAVFSGVVMAGVVWFWRDLFLLIPIILGAVTYIGLILILRVIPKEDWEMIRESIVNIRNKILKRSAEPAGLIG